MNIYTSETIVKVTGAAFLAVVLLSPAACTVHRHYRVAEAIKAGADPLEAKCALEAQDGPDAICEAVARRKGSR